MSYTVFLDNNYLLAVEKSLNDWLYMFLLKY